MLYSRNLTKKPSGVASLPDFAIPPPAHTLINARTSPEHSCSTCPSHGLCSLVAQSVLLTATSDLESFSPPSQTWMAFWTSEQMRHFVAVGGRRRAI